MTAARSADRKTEWLRKKLAPWADRIGPMVSPAGPDRVGYREKTCLSAEWDGAAWQIGLKAGDDLIPIFDCPVHGDRIRRSMAMLAPALPPAHRFPLHYFVQSGAQVTLVVKARHLPEVFRVDDGLWQQLMGCGVEGLWLHLFASVGRKVFAKNGWHLIRGSARSVDAEGFAYGPVAFQQVFAGLHHRALDRAAAFFAPGPGDAVIDLYCGLGRTLARWRRSGAIAAGVELCGEAVACARTNAPGTAIFRGACAQRVVQLEEWRNGPAAGKRFLLYANPPRTGLEPEVIDWVLAARPAKMAYLSCSAGTLRRDLDRLCAGGFDIRSIHPYDFFPRTRHVETLVALKPSG